MHSYDGTIKWDAVLVCRKTEEGVEDGGKTIVPTGAHDKAVDAVNSYAARLSHAQGVGFHLPDRLNLYRALIVSEARVGEPTSRWMTLEAALKANPEQPKEDAADG